MNRRSNDMSVQASHPHSSKWEDEKVRRAPKQLLLITMITFCEFDYLHGIYQNVEDFQYSCSHQMHKITSKFAHINTTPTPLGVSLQIKRFKTMSNISEASLVPTPSKLILPTPTVTTVLIITRLKSFSNLPYLHTYTFKKYEMDKCILINHLKK
ncbi:uncharacterized protein LOC144340642 [Macaca mulatta]